MKSTYVVTRSANVGDIRCLFALASDSTSDYLALHWIHDKVSILIYLVLYITHSTLLVILWQRIRRAEEPSTYSWSWFCTVHC